MNKQRIQLIEMEVYTWPDWAQAAYQVMVDNGQSPVFAHMCVSRESWSVRNSDKAFNEGQRRKMSNMTENNRDRMVEIARKAGINTNGKYYVGGLGRYNDPHAWVSTADDVIDVCKKKNLTATGVVNHKAREVGPVKRKDLADDIVRRKVSEKLEADPALSERVRRGKTHVGDVVEQVRSTHAFRPTSD